MSEVKVPPFTVTNTVAIFGAVMLSLTPSSRSHQVGDEMKASSAADDSRAFRLSNSRTNRASRTAAVSTFRISSSLSDLTPVGTEPMTGTTVQETSVPAPAPSAFLVTMKHGRNAPSGKSCAAYKPTSAATATPLLRPLSAKQNSPNKSLIVSTATASGMASGYAMPLQVNVPEAES